MLCGYSHYKYILVFLAFEAVETSRNQDFLNKIIEIICCRKSYKPQP